MAAPSPPVWKEPPANWAHKGLYDDVKATLHNLPAYFESDLVITGILATDLFSFSGSLGSTIEEQVVKALNKLRSSWDPNEKYSGYRFVRQPQRFPDVTLRAADPSSSTPVLMGIELKGWYALAKESEPSFRHTVTAKVCADADLIAIYPWALTHAVSGSPQLFEPFVTGAGYTADYRNYYWQYVRETKANTAITLSTVSTPYPEKSDKISDVPAEDGGGNFGRIARTNIMKKFIEKLDTTLLVGIPLHAWRAFFQSFSENSTVDEVVAAVKRLAANNRKALGGVAKADAVAEQLLQLYQAMQKP